MRNKSDLFEHFKVFEAEVENKFNKRMKMLRTDQGREYICHWMQSYMESRGIKWDRLHLTHPNRMERVRDLIRHWLRQHGR